MDASPLGDGVNWRLNKPLVYTSPTGVETVIPEGFVTDFASVPDLARLGLAVLIVGYFLSFIWLVAAGAVIIFFSKTIDDNAKTDEPAVLHDWRYARQDKTFFFANWELFTTLGIGNPLWLRFLYWFNLTLFGIFAWKSDAKKSKYFIGRK